MDTIIQLENISFSYHRQDGEILALSDVSFSVKKGEFVSIVGPSGCGKSTILSILAGLQKEESGRLEISPSVNFGYMFQQDLLLPYLTVWKNVCLGPSIHHQKDDSVYQYIEDLLEKYGLSGFRNKYPSQLSGGMRQRAALIRTLALNPDVLLLDEPFSALDYQTRLMVSNDICRLIRAAGKTMIIITHDLSEAISLADRIIVLSGRPAVVKNEMPIKLTLSDNSPLAARNAPEFQNLFNMLWEDLTHENEKKL